MALPAVAAAAGKALKAAQLAGAAKKSKGALGKILLGGLVALVGGFSSFMSQAIARGEAQRLSGDGYWAPAALRQSADDASAKSHTPAGILLAVAYVETSYGRHRTASADLAGQLELGLPGDIRAEIDPGKLGPGGATALMLGSPGPIRPGDWINPEAVGSEHAVGFMQFLPGTWREYSAAATTALGHLPDPYAPLDAMTAAGLKIQHDLPGGGDRYSAYVAALDAYGGRGYGLRVMGIAAIAVVRPGRALACPAVLTQGYGPVSFGLEPPLRGAGHYHTGIDLSCPLGTAVLSLTAGVAHVYSAGGWGNEVVIAVGGYHIRYCHLAAAGVADGQVVKTGDVIGLEGSTGASSGPHLHLELDQGPAAASDFEHSVPPFALLDPAAYTVGSGVEGALHG